MKRSLISDLSYAQPKSFPAAIAGRNITFISKPGLPLWDRISPAACLLAEKAEFSPEDSVLLMGCGHGAIAAAIAPRLPRGEIWLADSSFVALQLSAQTLQANQITNAHILSEISLPASQEGSFAAVLIDLPKGRKLAQRWLAEAWRGLRPGGRLYLAGANQQGVQPVAKDAQILFGNGSILAYKKGCRIVSLRRPSGEMPQTGWWREAGIAPDTWLQIRVDAPQGNLALYSLPGVFSNDRLDPGTRLLLDHLNLSPGERVLDLGCGYGIIGLKAAQAGAAQVDLVDANLLAVACAAKNAAVYARDKARCLPSDVLSAVADQRYTLIASNPPFHTGHAVDYLVAEAFIQQSYQALEPGGRLFIVANQFIQYGRLMAALFSRVETVYGNQQYHILQSMK